VVVPNKTILEQNDYVAFVAFENRNVHQKVVNAFSQPDRFIDREMLFELNNRSTSYSIQEANRKRFNENLAIFNQSIRYFEYKRAAPDEAEYKPNSKLTPLELLNRKKLGECFIGEPKTKASTSKAVDLGQREEESNFLKSRIAQLEAELLKAQLDKIRIQTEHDEQLRRLLSDREEAHKKFIEVMNLTQNRFCNIFSFVVHFCSFFVFFSFFVHLFVVTFGNGETCCGLTP
jgi:hypothetical protein